MRAWVKPLSLRAQAAVVTGLLSFVPSSVVLLVLLVRDLALASRLLWPLLLWLLVVGVLSGLIGYLLSGSLLSPVTRLEGDLAALGEGSGELQPRLDDPAEVSRLRAAFLALLRRLRREQDRRSAFLAALTHHLKTPLLATRHLLGALPTLDPAGQQALIGRIQSENQRLLATVQQMVDAHRYERQQVQLEPQRFALEPWLEEFRERYAARAAPLGLRLEVQGSGEVLADPAALQRAVANLLDNALRYARSEVRLSAAREGGEIRLRVQDDGPGLPAPFALLSQPFTAQPIEIAGIRYAAGAGGLGLFIARSIAEAHGGRLEAEPGPGARLCLALRAPAAARR